MLSILRAADPVVAFWVGGAFVKNTPLIFHPLTCKFVITKQCHNEIINMLNSSNNPYGFDNDILLYMENLKPEEREEIREEMTVFGVLGCGMYLLGLVIVLMVCALLSGCKTKDSTVVELRDSIRTEVVTNTVIIPDTQYVTLPAQIVERTTPDTTSTLRISFAESTASIRGGLLFHSLRSLDTPLPVPVQHKETTRDSIVYREKEVPVPVPVVKEVERQFTTWQQIRLWLGNMVIVALGIASGVWIIRKRTWWLRLFR